MSGMTIACGLPCSSVSINVAVLNKGISDYVFFAFKRSPQRIYFLSDKQGDD